MEEESYLTTLQRLAQILLDYQSRRDYLSYLLASGMKKNRHSNKQKVQELNQLISDCKITMLEFIHLYMKPILITVSNQSYLIAKMKTEGKDDSIILLPRS